MVNHPVVCNPKKPSRKRHTLPVVAPQRLLRLQKNVAGQVFRHGRVANPDEQVPENGWGIPNVKVSKGVRIALLCPFDDLLFARMQKLWHFAGPPTTRKCR